MPALKRTLAALLIGGMLAAAVVLPSSEPPDVTVTAAAVSEPVIFQVFDEPFLHPMPIPPTTTTTTAPPPPKVHYHEPAVAAPPPPAASSGVNWDAIAACESGGNWSIDTGNGYSGGLQFSRSSWNGSGGQQYAAEAWQATREQQIATAMVLSNGGANLGHWPNCGSRG